MKTGFYSYKRQFDIAMHLATEKHGTQRDRGGQPYILHLIRVMMKQDTLLGKIVAILHDILEDTNITAEDLIDRGLSDEVVHHVLRLTRQSNETKMAAAKRAASYPLTLKIKIDDVEDNLNLSRLKRIDEKDLPRLQEYLEIHQFLVSVRDGSST